MANLRMDPKHTIFSPGPFHRSRTLVLLLVVAAVATGRAFAQKSPIPGEKKPSAEQRAKLYKALARDVTELEKRDNILKRVVKLVKPSVVHIEAQKAGGSGFGSRGVEEAGSGVIIKLKDKFYVLTNRHVIHHSTVERIKIKLADGRVIYPVKVWKDRGTDVAIMALKDSALVASRLGNSDKMEIGDFVLAVGSPFGLSHSVSYGIISAKGRRDLSLGSEGVRYQNFMQTDAAINPGNSGGPLINLRAEVIGINTAIASNSGGNEGIGFTIPVNMVMTIAKQLIENGNVVRAFLGVTLDSKFGPEMATKIGLSSPQGAMISGITAKSPAETAKLKIGDVILEFGNTRIEDDSHLVNTVSLTRVGKSVPLVIFRDRKVKKLMVTVGDRKKFETPK